MIKKKKTSPVRKLHKRGKKEKYNIKKKIR